MVWLVVGGPAVVVVASFATLALALIYPDPPLPPAPRAVGAAGEPALQARNHAVRP